MLVPPAYRMETAFSCRGVPYLSNNIGLQEKKILTLEKFLYISGFAKNLFPSSMQGEQAWMKKSDPISWTIGLGCECSVITVCVSLITTILLLLAPVHM